MDTIQSNSVEKDDKNVTSSKTGSSEKEEVSPAKSQKNEGKNSAAAVEKTPDDTNSVKAGEMEHSEVSQFQIYFKCLQFSQNMRSWLKSLTKAARESSYQLRRTKCWACTLWLTPFQAPMG